MTKTESEIIFEGFCDDLSISCTPIPCEKNQTPDYDLRLHCNQVIVEIKQLDLNDDDIRNWNDVRAQGVGSAWGGTEERLGRKIKKANKQLKAKCNGTIPGIAVVFDNGSFSGIDATDIKEAMFGKETVTISRSGHEVVPVSGIHSGRDGRLSPTSNTTISALASLRGSRESCRLTLYHNHFAANPIDPNWFRHDRFVHYGLSPESYDWISI